MVWGLFPSESLPGEQKYFIFTKGTYKVGRKGCDIIINTDKGVSRIHAEVVVDSMISMDPLQKKSTEAYSGVRIKDLSKYGTFINKNLGSKTKVHEYPNKEAVVKDGDFMSFGTGNATYRFCSVPFVFFVYCLKPNQMEHSIQEEIFSIGARATHSWSEECTHVLVGESMPVKADLLDAIVAQKPVVLRSWMKGVAGKGISTDIPSYADYFPTLLLEGFTVKVVDPKVRENCLSGYTFLLGALNLYKFEHRLRSLLDIGGAKVLSVNEFSSNSQMSTQKSESGEDNRVVLVIPTVSANQFNHIQQLRSLSRVNELNLVSAVLSGHMDPSSVAPAPASIHVSSSCSTDETIVADSDVEVDMVQSDPVVASVALEESGKFESKEEIYAPHVDTGKEKVGISSLQVKDVEETRKDDSKREIYEHYVGTSKEKSGIPIFQEAVMIDRRIKSDNSENQNSDVLYSQDLIVRDNNNRSSAHSTTINGVVNFKCFKKREETQSGNSFGNLIPFSKYPYKESDVGNEEAEHVKEEKKRKHVEAIAEDLFNNEKPRRQRIAGSYGHLTHG